MKDSQKVLLKRIKLTKKDFNYHNMVSCEGIEYIPDHVVEELFDVGRNRFLQKFNAEIYAHSLPKKIITFTIPKPRFLDWLFKRQRTIQIEVNRDVIMKKEDIPPILDNGVLYYYDPTIKGE